MSSANRRSVWSLLGRGALVFLFLSLASVSLRWYPSDCGYLPALYRTASTEKRFMFRDRSIVGQPDCILDVGYSAIGFPAYYIVSGSPFGGRRPFWGRGSDGVVLPGYVIVNVLWMAALSLGVSHAWERCWRRRAQRNADLPEES